MASKKPSAKATTGRSASALIVCAGLPRSASTRVFNLLRGLADPRTTTGIYADAISPALSAELRTKHSVILKSHVPDTALCTLIEATNAPIILTIRDPRDCVCSMMTQFNFSFPEALAAVRASTVRLMDLQAEKILIIRYEDSRDLSTMTAREIARHVGMERDDAVLNKLLKTLMPQRIRREIERYLENGEIDPQQPASSFHEVTHWHPNHIGDGEVGKYRSAISENQAAVIYNHTQAFCERFGYPASLPEPIGESRQLVFGTEPSPYLTGGFSDHDGWQTWSDAPTATLRFPMRSDAACSAITLTLGLSEVLRRPGGVMRVYLNETHLCSLSDVLREPLQLVLALAAKGEPGEAMAVRMEFDGLSSPKDMGINDDTRLLGAAIASVNLETRITPALPALAKAGDSPAASVEGDGQKVPSVA